MPSTTLKSPASVIGFALLLILSIVTLLLINQQVDFFNVHFEIPKQEKFFYQLVSICLLSMIWFSVLAVKKRIKASLVGLAVALVNSFSAFQLIEKLKMSYSLDLPFDLVALSSCIAMVFVLNKRYFSRIVD